jgi:type III restriction enzyme
VQVEEAKGTVTLAAPLTAAEIKEVATGFVMEAHGEQFVVAATEHTQAVEAIFASPAERGERLMVPLFGVERQGERELLDETHFMERPWSLRDFLDDPAVMGEIAVGEPQGVFGEVGLNDKGIVMWDFGTALADQLALVDVAENWTEARLVDWIDRNIPPPDIGAEESGVFISRLIETWLGEEWTVGRLVREWVSVRDRVEKRIELYRKTARAKAFQDVLFNEVTGPVSVAAEPVFAFDPDRYPARSACRRSADFKKHFHRQVGELKDEGEEFAWALFLDQLPEVAVWVRYLERQPSLSFWLQTARDKFYPDFVARLTNGRVLVVGYKGEDRWSNDDSKEKRRLGELWATRSGGKGVFVMPQGTDLDAIRKALNEGNRLAFKAREDRRCSPHCGWLGRSSRRSDLFRWPSRRGWSGRPRGCSRARQNRRNRRCARRRCG